MSKNPAKNVPIAYGMTQEVNLRGINVVYKKNAYFSVPINGILRLFYFICINNI